MKVLIASVLVGAIAINANSANAQARIIKDTQGQIFLLGFAANGTFEINYLDAGTREFEANSCGLVFIPNSLVDPSKAPFTFSKRDGTESRTYYSTGFVKNKPDCFNGTLSDPTYNTESTDFFTVTSENKTIGFMVAKLVPNELYKILYAKVRNIKSDACGTIKVTNTPDFPLGEVITMGGSTVGYIGKSVLPVETPPLCRKGVEFLASNTMANGSMLIRKNPKGDIIYGAVPNSTTDIVIYSVPISKLVLSNRCGLVKIKPSARKPINSNPIIKDGSSDVQIAEWNGADYADLIPKCSIVKGQPIITNNFSPLVVKIGEDYWFKSLIPQKTYKVEWTSNVRKIGKVNACGLGKISNSTSTPIVNSVSVNGIAIRPSELVASDKKEVCVGGIYYKPK
jgi:hypothetical protein